MKTKTERITLLREFLVTQMNHWILFPLYSMFAVVLSDIIGTGKPHILLWLVLGIVPFSLYLGRCMLQKFRSLFVSHVCVILIMFFLPAEHIAFRVFYILIGVIYVIYSCHLWSATANRQDIKFYPLLAVAISLLCLFILHAQNHMEWDAAYATLLIIALGIYFVIYYIEQYQNFLTVNNSSAGHIPASEMFRSGIRLVLGYTGIGTIALILFTNTDWLRGILDTFKNLLIALLNLILSLFPQNTEAIVSEIPEETLATMEEGSGMEFTETFWFWNVLEYVIEFVFLALFIFVLIKLTLFLIRFIKAKLKGFSNDKSKASEEEVIDIREKCDIVKNQRRSRSFSFLNLSPTEKIRSCYKKRILASRSDFPEDGESRLKLYTARESGKILNRANLADIYEKARYSNEECDNEDVKRMKEACR